MKTQPRSEVMDKTNAKDMKISVATALVLAVLTMFIGSRILERLENVQSVSAPKWILGRATGLTSYLLMLLLVSMGLLLSHPNRGNWARPSALNRIRVHVSLAVFSLVFLVSHIFVLATDSYAGVGVLGSFLPFQSTYRPAAVTLGILALWSGLISGITAGLAGSRALVNVWWPVHKVAIVAFFLTWLHAVLAGSDTLQLRLFYVATGLFVIFLAIWRYTTTSHSERIKFVAHRAKSSKQSSQVK